MYAGFQYWTISGASSITIDSNVVYVQGNNDAQSAPRFYGIVWERNRGFQPGPSRHEFEAAAADDPSSATTLSGSTFRVVSNTVIVNAYFPYSSMVALRINLDPIALGDSRLLLLSNVLTARTMGSVTITGSTPSVYSTIALDVSKPVSYTHLRAHETPEHLVCRLLLEKKKNINLTTLLYNYPSLNYQKNTSKRHKDY
eukprot:TRINITY_DN14105_c0_g1_i1.p1 TRINITY_DN14105_c0_g1~~TRINITY_DN14105_c0_g1_i1.p1  ORF type:complete len:199 (-),score=10.30 TRINITY_DN14105_c0_g1_i1:37-633(-)